MNSGSLGALGASGRRRTLRNSAHLVTPRVCRDALRPTWSRAARRLPTPRRRKDSCHERSWSRLLPGADLPV